MARSEYIYNVETKEGKVIASGTVKSEILSKLKSADGLKEVGKSLEVYRIADGQWHPTRFYYDAIDGALVERKAKPATVHALEKVG